jgi:hypothetical protein
LDKVTLTVTVSPTFTTIEDELSVIPNIASFRWIWWLVATAGSWIWVAVKSATTRIIAQVLMV